MQIWVENDTCNDNASTQEIEVGSLYGFGKHEVMSAVMGQRWHSIRLDQKLQRAGGQYMRWMNESIGPSWVIVSDGRTWVGCCEQNDKSTVFRS